MTAREKPAVLETTTIQAIALDQRHGRARDLFTVWFGSNIMLLTIVTGALAVTAFHLPFWWGVVAVTVGNLVGAVFMALHAAQGPTLGVPQMVQTRGQFGSYGSLLVVGMVIVMYLGFCASNLVVGGQSLKALAPSVGAAPGVVFVGLLSFFAAVWGHDMIHYYARIMTIVSGIALIVAFAWVFGVHGLPADFYARNTVTVGGMLGGISVAALWQISYAPYVSDYSRYLPAETGARPAFWASYWGCSLGSTLPMILGVAVALTITGEDVVAGLAKDTGGLAAIILLIFSLSIANTTAINLYCGALSCLTFGQTLLPSWSPRARARTIAVVVLSAVALGLALLTSDSFMASYTDFILFLLYLLVPWTAINLVDYYLVQHGKYDVAAFLRADGGIYGRVNGPAVTCYVLGFLVQVPFIASPVYTGPIAKKVDGADLSWIVGLVFTSVLYYVWARAVKARGVGAGAMGDAGTAKAGAA
jgi:NCS1 family nucleobase:cation symporter-1